MKRFLALLLAACMGASLLAGCGAPKEEASDDAPVAVTETAEHLRILLPSTAGASVVQAHKDAFIAALRTAMEEQGWNVEEITLDTASTEAASGKALDDGTADVVILPASQYFTYRDDTGLLMTATYPGLSVSTTRAADWNGSVDAVHYTDEDCPYRRTLICATSSDAGRAIAQKAAAGTLAWEDLESVRWLYPRAESSSDFMYPDLWLSSSFGKTMEDLTDVLAIDGYGALFAEAALDEADVVVIAADERVDYAAAWQLAKDDMDYTGKMGLGRQDSIFNDLTVIGVTEPVYGDVMTVRTEDEHFADAGFQTALINAMTALQGNDDARAIWESCGYTGFVPSGDSHYENIQDLTIYGAGD